MASPKAAGYAQLREVSYAQFKGRQLAMPRSIYEAAAKEQASSNSRHVTKDQFLGYPDRVD